MSVRIRKERCNTCEKELFFYYDINGSLYRVCKISKFLDPIGLECVYCKRKVLSTPRKLEIGRFKEECECAWCDSKLEVKYEIYSDEIVISCIGIKSNLHSIDDEKIGIFHCEHIGVAGTTEIVFKKINNQWKARMGIAVLGGVNFEEMIGANPFQKEYHDNYVEGVGETKEEAIENMKKEIENIQKGLWE
jgi:hypothetical protein